MIRRMTSRNVNSLSRLVYRKAISSTYTPVADLGGEPRADMPDFFNEPHRHEVPGV